MDTTPVHPSNHQQQHVLAGLDIHSPLAIAGQMDPSSPYLVTPTPAQHAQPHQEHPAPSLQHFQQTAGVLQPITAAAGDMQVNVTGTDAADTAVDISSWLQNPAGVPQSPEPESAPQLQPSTVAEAHVQPLEAAAAAAAPISAAEAEDKKAQQIPSGDGNSGKDASDVGQKSTSSGDNLLSAMQVDGPPTAAVVQDLVDQLTAALTPTHESAAVPSLPLQMMQQVTSTAAPAAETHPAAADAAGNSAAVATQPAAGSQNAASINNVNTQLLTGLPVQQQHHASREHTASSQPPPPTAPAVCLPLRGAAAGQVITSPDSAPAATTTTTTTAGVPAAAAAIPAVAVATSAAAGAISPIALATQPIAATPVTILGGAAPAATASAPAATPLLPAAAAAAAGGGQGSSGGGHRKRGRKHPKQPPPGAKNQLKGVFWDRKTGRWRSQLGYHNKKIFMGYFNTPQEAAVAYDKKAVELHGMLAKTNFPIQNYLQLLPEGAATALPTAEMAIPLTKKQHTETAAAAAAAAGAEGVSLHAREGQMPAAAAASGDGSADVSGGPGLSEGGKASEALATGGDDSPMQDIQQQHQRQQQRQRTPGSGGGSQGLAEQHEGTGQGDMVAAAAAAAGSDGGVDVPVLPAAAAAAAALAEGILVGAPAERPARKKRKSTAAADHAQYPLAGAGAAGMDVDVEPSFINNISMITSPRPTVVSDSSRQQQQQQRMIGHAGTSSARGRGHGRRGAPRGARSRGRPRSVIRHQAISGWDRSLGPEGDDVTEDYVSRLNRPGMHVGVQQYRGTHSTHQQYQDLEGYHSQVINQGSTWDQRSGSDDLMMLEQQLQGMASADITAAEALAGLLQLGEVQEEPDVQGYSQQQQQQQPGYQDYEDEPGDISWFEQQPQSQGLSKGSGSRGAGVLTDEQSGFTRPRRRVPRWQQLQGYGEELEYKDEEMESAAWQQQQQQQLYTGGSTAQPQRSGRLGGRAALPAAETDWQQQQQHPYLEVSDQYAAAAAADPWIPRGHALRSGGLAGFWPSDIKQDNIGYQVAGNKDNSAAAAAARRMTNAPWPSGSSSSGLGRNTFANDDAQDPNAYGRRRSKKRRGVEHYDEPAASAMEQWQQQQQHIAAADGAWEHAAAAALAALPAAGRPGRSAAAVVQEEDQEKTPGFDQIMQAVQAAIAETNVEQQQQRQRHQPSPRSNVVSPTQVEMLQQLKDLLHSRYQELRQDYQAVKQQLSAVEKERAEAAAAAAAAGRPTGPSQSLLAMLSSAVSPAAAAAAAAPMQADTHVTAASPMAADYGAAAAAAAAAAAMPAAVTGDDLIDEALLLLPPDQQDIINKQPALKALLGKLVGGSQIIGNTTQQRSQQQQQQQQQQFGLHPPSLLSQTLHTPDTQTAAATSPAAAAAAAKAYATGPASILSALRPPISKQPDTAATSHPSAAAAAAAPTQGFKRKFSNSGFTSAHGFSRPSATSARGTSEVNPGGVTFRKHQPKPLKLWGSVGQGIGATPGQGSGKSLSPGSGKGSSPMGLLPPSAPAAAAAAGRSSSSTAGGRSLVSSSDHQLQLPQLVPLPELHTQPAEQQQQQQQQGSDELGRLVAALLGVVKPETAAAAAPAAADQTAGASPAAMGFNAAAEPIVHEHLNGNTSPMNAAEVAISDRAVVGARSHAAAAAASSTPPGHITPASQQQEQQSANHFIYIPPGTSLSPAAAITTMQTHTSPSAAPATAAAAGLEANRSGNSNGGYLLQDPSQMTNPLPPSDMSASLSFREWQAPRPTAAAAAAAAAATTDKLQRATAAAAAAAPASHSGLDPSLLRQSALAALQAANQAVTAGSTQGCAAAADADANTDKQQQQQQWLHDLGLQLHVLPPHAMMLPDELLQLQQAATAAAAAVGTGIGSTGDGGSSSSGHLGFNSSALLSCVAALPSVLSTGGGVCADVWDRVKACVTANDAAANRGNAAAAAARRSVEGATTDMAALEGNEDPEASLDDHQKLDIDRQLAVKVHFEVLGSTQQQQRHSGHLVLLPVVVPLAAHSVADRATAEPLQLPSGNLDAPVDYTPAAPPSVEVQQQQQHQQQHQRQQADGTQECSDLSRLPPLLRQKLIQLRTHIQELQGGVLRPEQDTNWLLKLMVAAMRRKVQAKQQQLQQQQSMQQQQPEMGSSRTVQTSIYNDATTAAATAAVPAVAGAASAVAGLARSSSSGGGRTVTTGVTTGVGDIGQLLAGAAAAGLLERGSGSGPTTR